MKKKHSRLLSTLLAVCMLLAMLPTAALAVENPADEIGDDTSLSTPVNTEPGDGPSEGTDGDGEGNGEGEGDDDLTDTIPQNDGTTFNTEADETSEGTIFGIGTRLANAQSAEVKYDTLAEALAALPSEPGENEGEVTTTASVYVLKDYTIEAADVEALESFIGEGKTYFSEGTERRGILISLANDVTLTLNAPLEIKNVDARHIFGGVTLDVAATAEKHAPRLVLDADLTIKECSTNTVIWVNEVEVNGATLTISDNTGIGLSGSITAVNEAEITVAKSENGHGISGSLYLDNATVISTENDYAGIYAENIAAVNSTIESLENARVSSATGTQRSDLTFGSAAGKYTLIDSSVTVETTAANKSGEYSIVSHNSTFTIDETEVISEDTTGSVKFDATVGSINADNIDESAAQSAPIINTTRGGSYSTLAEAVAANAAESGDTLLFTATANVGGDVVIDMDLTFIGTESFVGPALLGNPTNNDTANNKSITITDDATVTFKDITVVKQDSPLIDKVNVIRNTNIVIKDNASLIVADNSASTAVWGGTLDVTNNGTLSITGTKNAGHGFSGALSADSGKIIISNNEGHGVSGNKLDLSGSANMTVEDNGYTGIFLQGDNNVGTGVTLTVNGNGTSENLTGDLVKYLGKDLFLEAKEGANATLTIAADDTDVTVGGQKISGIVTAGETVTVTFYDDETLLETIEEIPVGGKITDVDGAVPSVSTRLGYTFEGWTIANNDDTVYKSDIVAARAVYVDTRYDSNFSGSGSISAGGGSSSTTTYTITATAGSGGSVSPSNRTVSRGNSLTITITPDSGYVVDDVTVNGSSVGAVTSYTFSNVRANQTLRATFKLESESGNDDDEDDDTSTNFSDVKTTDWYADAVSYVYENNLFNGTSTTTFSPNANMTREMFVTVLGRLADSLDLTTSGHSASFSDVASGQYYTSYVAWANANNIVTGYNTTTFGTGDSITREQMAVLLIRFAEYAEIELSTGSRTTFADASQINNWATDAVNAASAAGLINGYSDSTFRPANTATRAEVATIFLNMSEYLD